MFRSAFNHLSRVVLHFKRRCVKFARIEILRETCTIFYTRRLTCNGKSVLALKYHFPWDLWNAVQILSHVRSGSEMSPPECVSSDFTFRFTRNYVYISAEIPFEKCARNIPAFRETLFKYAAGVCPNCGKWHFYIDIGGRIFCEKCWYFFR